MGEISQEKYKIYYQWYGTYSMENFTLYNTTVAQISIPLLQKTHIFAKCVLYMSMSSNFYPGDRWKSFHEIYHLSCPV